ncbi:diphthine--ammonia ligase [Cytobacillus suaedae]|nr:diphthine--ammonia ligase [Cytobacillus suaedae]
MSKNRIVISFSGGKDSTLALHRIIQSDNWMVDSLLVTLNEENKRTSMHGVRESLLNAQAQALGIPLRKVYIPPTCTNEQYEKIMGKALEEIKQDGISYIMFGDIHLEDVKTYREKMLADSFITSIFPLWGEDSQSLINEFLELGFKTVVTCVDGVQLDPTFVGRVIDKGFIAELPKSVDPCGENGEFHTFVFGGPLFSKKIEFTISDETTITKDLFTGKDRFYYVDLNGA